MKRLVLIQNQTEMANYGHADCRPLLNKLGHDYVLLTADTIGSLDDIAANGAADAILVGSNSLHDPVIRSYLEADEGRRSIEMLVQAGAGLALMMQYKAAYDKYTLPLPMPFQGTRAIPRPVAETASTARLASAVDAICPPILSYPKEVSVSDLEASGRQHPSLAGVYWHYWEIDPSLWDIHVVSNDQEPARPLFLSAREHLGKRVVLSALPIDWQGQAALFENLLTYILDGRHGAALIGVSSADEVISTYLSAKLASRGTSHRTYADVAEARTEAARNAIRGVHNTLLLPEQGDLATYFGEREGIQLIERLNSGALRVVALERSGDGFRVNVSGRRSAARDAYELLVPSIGRALTEGYLDGSFRGTVSGLEELLRLPHGLATSLFPLRRVLEECERRDRHGSYDEVIGASAALLWVRGHALGVAHPDTIATLTWLRGRFETTDARERLHTLGILDELRLLREDERCLALRTLEGVDIDRSTELELIAFLEAATRFKCQQQIVGIIGELSYRSKQAAGAIWVDIATTAGLVKILLLAKTDYIAASPDAEAAEHVLLELIVPAIIAIEEAYYRSLVRVERGATFPWDGKASTTLRCLSAWYLFEQWLAAPVEEAAEAIVQSSRRAALNTLADAAVKSMEGLIARQVELQDTISAQTATVTNALGTENAVGELQRDLRRVIRFARIVFFLLMIGSYIVGDHVVRTRLFGDRLEFGDSLAKHFKAHAAVAAFLVAAFAVPWNSVFNFVDTRIRGSRAVN